MIGSDSPYDFLMDGLWNNILITASSPFLCCKYFYFTRCASEKQAEQSHKTPFINTQRTIY